ncbi:unnamed protein product [Owenia fusiformis]|uniref:Uncharacterized protein n=1 Tax=Owenia fusiformis TaxID=6347 RepID=A0A8J1UKA2_OWEFU|nr:unnamed protein product [Owenia fusiformis]
MAKEITPVVESFWLAQQLEKNDGTICLLDGSWHMPFSKRNAWQEYYRRHIPYALFFNIEECCDKNSNLPFMLPTAEEFETYVGSLGISNETHVVIYDNHAGLGMFSSPRIWWMFRAFGHEKVSVLDGGFPRWEKDGFTETDEIPKVGPKTFKANYRPDLVRTYEDIERNLTSNEFVLVDARPSGRFCGTSPEPRPDIKGGHVPGAISIPFSSLLLPQRKALKMPETNERNMKEAGVDMERSIVTMCGDGLNSAFISLVCHQMGKTDVAIYDGSWTEYYARAPFDKKEDVPARAF